MVVFSVLFFSQSRLKALEKLLKTLSVAFFFKSNIKLLVAVAAFGFYFNINTNIGMKNDLQISNC